MAKVKRELMHMSPLTHKLSLPASAVLIACFLLFFFFSDLSGIGYTSYSPPPITAGVNSLFDTAEQDLGGNTLKTSISLQALAVLSTSHYTRIGDQPLDPNNTLLGTYRFYLFQAPPRQSINS